MAQLGYDTRPSVSDPILLTVGRLMYVIDMSSWEQVCGSLAIKPTKLSSGGERGKGERKFKLSERQNRQRSHICCVGRQDPRN
jgi:hypothetical protein